MFLVGRGPRKIRDQSSFELELDITIYQFQIGCN